jgi:micrococcal nuclease
MDRPSFWDKLSLIPEAELRSLQQRLDEEFEHHWGLLKAAEARKTAFDQQGVAEHSRRGQEALARQVANLEHRAALQAELLRLIGKQQRLLDRLLWARETSERWEALRASAPAAVGLDWDDLVAAADEVARHESKLDALLRILGVPEEEWPKFGTLRPPTSAEGAAAQDPDEPVLVNKALDGQSLRLATGETVRYIGVDAPLLQGSFSRPQAGAQEAWRANRDLVEGRYVRLEADEQERDIEGVLWRYVWIGKICINAELIRKGYAYHLPRSPNYRHSEWFAQMEKQAKRKKRGVWE